MCETAKVHWESLLLPSGNCQIIKYKCLTIRFVQDNHLDTVFLSSKCSQTASVWHVAINSLFQNYTVMELCMITLARPNTTNYYTVLLSHCPGQFTLSILPVYEQISESDVTE